MNVVAEMLLTDPAPAAIWAGLMLLALPALLLLGSPTGLKDPRRAARDMVGALDDHRRQAAEAAHAVRFAEEVRAAAHQAADHADLWQRRWEQCTDEVDEAWQSWLTADTDLKRLLAAAAWRSPAHDPAEAHSLSSPSTRTASPSTRISSSSTRTSSSSTWTWSSSTRNSSSSTRTWSSSTGTWSSSTGTWSSSTRTCEEYAARDRFLHRAVAAAVERGALPDTAITDALTGRDGWDARLHPVDQELAIAQASAAWQRHRYEQAVAAEKTAWHDADLARRTRDSLHHEAARTAATIPAVSSSRAVTKNRLRTVAVA